MTKRDHPTVQGCEAAIRNSIGLAATGGIRYDTPLERDLIRAWHYGRTRPVRLGPQHLQSMTDYFRRNRGYRGTDIQSEPYDPPGSVRRQTSFARHYPHPEYDGLGQVQVIFDRDDNVIGVEDNMDFNDRQEYGIPTRIGMALVRRNRRLGCGTSGDFSVTGGTGR